MNRIIGERPLSATGLSDAEVQAMYVDMVRARRFDERALALQRRGWMSGYPPFRGQEASQIGAAHAMADADWLFPTYRSLAMELAVGVPMADLLRFRRGHAEYGSDHDLPVFPQAVPIATQIPHAVGAGMAVNYEDADHAVVCYLGDGATSEGDFHEGLNFAGVFETPTVFFCENNGWAISLPRERQTASETIAQKAFAYGFDGMQVDGNDPLAVRETVADALDRARDGTPVLVESLTYRQGAHTTSDDPSRYREEADLPEWRTRDPLERFEEYLRERDLLDEEFVEDARADADAELEKAIEAVEAGPPADPDEVFDYVYDQLPPELADQSGWLHSFLEGNDVQELDH